MQRWITHAAWETERLTDIIYDPDSRFGGVVFFLGPDGQKHMLEIGPAESESGR
ncbi:MAG: methane monooxygenase/ammonia monooxygenase subunit B [Gammaproteobacteria bacterium]